MWHDYIDGSGIPYSQLVVLRSLSLDGFVFGGGWIMSSSLVLCWEAHGLAQLFGSCLEVVWILVVYLSFLLYGAEGR